MQKVLKFPKNFLWGSATSSYQIEGGIKNCDWARFYDAGRACDHYNKYKKDFDLLKRLNQNAYRFSIEWSRIEPKQGKFDRNEIEHYREVLRTLKNCGIKTIVTLHHFTNPLWLIKIGGWADSKVIFYFSRFAEKMLKEYQDLVDFWLTINEPLIYSLMGYLNGKWPPNKKNLLLFLKVVENQIASHKKIYRIFHQIDPKVKIGIAKNNQYFEPLNPKSELDKFSTALCRYFWNGYFLNKIKNHLDFIGLNYYLHYRIKFPFFRENENKIVNDIGWEIYPKGIYCVLKSLKKYDLPVYITENGLADAEDKLRKDFIKEHLFWTYKAVQEKVDVRGYFHWSLMDNFEWEKGFEPRFGLVEVDYETMERKFRPSAFYYAEICKNNAVTINSEINNF